MFIRFVNQLGPVVVNASAIKAITPPPPHGGHFLLELLDGREFAIGDEPEDSELEAIRIMDQLAPGGRDPTALALAVVRKRLEADPEEAWELAQQMESAGESPDDEQLRVMIVGEYERRGLDVPALFRKKVAP